MQKIFIASDHRGFETKNNLLANFPLNPNEFELVDCGPLAYDENDNYNDGAKKVARLVLENPKSFGILLCGSAVGMSIQANRFKGIRAAICLTPAEAIETRSHNNSNVLCLPADDIAGNDVYDIINAFMDTQPLQDEKYQRRCRKLDED